MGSGKIVGVGPDHAEDVEMALDAAESFMDEEDPSESKMMAHICRCYTGSE